jgi:hypothetical protein
MRVRNGKTHRPRYSIHVQDMSAPGKSSRLALKVNAIPFVPIDVSDTRETSPGLCDLFENTFAAVTKI